MLSIFAPFFLTSIVVSLAIFANANQNVAEKFSKDEVVPDLVDKAPREGLTVVYPSGKKANFGNELKPEDAQNQPAVTWLYREHDLYTVSMSDLDVPNRQTPTSRSINHWLVVNIKGKDIDIAGGDAIVSYRQPRPSKNTGLHRYVLLVYKQSGRIDKNSLPSIIATEPRFFSIRDFAKQQNMGDPVAGNYFVAQYDDFVGILQSVSSSTQPTSSAKYK